VIAATLDAVTPAKCYNYFKTAGYERE